MEKSVKRIDLHTHSVFSDGSFTPAEIIEEAEKYSVAAVALCDHNTVEGTEEFLTAAEGSCVIPVTGTEISVSFKEKEFHILGLYYKREVLPVLSNFFETVNYEKDKSNRELAFRLKKAGFWVDYDKICADAANATPNRVHFARELVRTGAVKTVDEAFSKFLHSSKGYYVPPKRTDALETVEFLDSLSVVSVLAHPFISVSEEETELFLKEAVKKGLKAMETDYSLYTEEQTKRAAECAGRHGILKSGGSDFHGENKPDIMIGLGKGELFVPVDYHYSLSALFN